MAKPDHNYRPSRERGVFVIGLFDDRLASSVIPQIVQFRAASPQPITVFIHSDGGSVRTLDAIQGALQTRDQDGKQNRVITVAIGPVASAGATLLSLGDYAIAYPDSTIHFHGVRLGELQNVTMEDASGLAKWLRERNEVTAIRLVGNWVNRLVFHYQQLASDFHEIRKEPDGEKLTDLECFAICLSWKLKSTIAANVVDKAMKRWTKIKKLSDAVFAKSRKMKDQSTFEASVLRDIIKFELKWNRGTPWRLDAAGLEIIVEDYLFLRDYYIGEYNKHLKELISRFVVMFLNPEELKSYEAESEDEKFSEKWSSIFNERLKPFLYFAFSLCRHLQESENELTASDAYWLGAIDEIMGNNKLQSLRMLMEAPDPLPGTPTPTLPISS